MADGKYFGMEKQEDEISRYENRYIKVNPHGISENYYGKLVEIHSSGNGTLNPYMNVDYSGNEPIRKIIENDKKGITVPLTASAITPFPRKNLEAFCVFWNNQDREAKKEKKQLEKRLKDKITGYQPD